MATRWAAPPDPIPTDVAIRIGFDLWGNGCWPYDYVFDLISIAVYPEGEPLMESDRLDAECREVSTTNFPADPGTWLCEVSLDFPLLPDTPYQVEVEWELGDVYFPETPARFTTGAGPSQEALAATDASWRFVRRDTDDTVAGPEPDETREFFGALNLASPITAPEHSLVMISVLAEGGQWRRPGGARAGDPVLRGEHPLDSMARVAPLDH